MPLSVSPLLGHVYGAVMLHHDDACLLQKLGAHEPACARPRIILLLVVPDGGLQVRRINRMADGIAVVEETLLRRAVTTGTDRTGKAGVDDPVEAHPAADRPRLGAGKRLHVHVLGRRLPPAIPAQPTRNKLG